MDFNYDAGFSFEKLGFDISGEISISNIPLTYSLTKTKKSKEGKFNLQANVIKVSDFYKAFAKKEESDESTSSFTDISLTKPRIIGVRGVNGNSELVVTGKMFNMFLYKHTFSHKFPSSYSSSSS